MVDTFKPLVLVYIRLGETKNVQLLKVILIPCTTTCYTVATCLLQPLIPISSGYYAAGTVEHPSYYTSIIYAKISTLVIMHSAPLHCTHFKLMLAIL